MLEPVRAEIFGPDRFAQHGRSLGLSHRARRARLGQPSFYPRLQNNIQSLRSAYRVLLRQAEAGQTIAPAAAWLLDNFHLIEGQLAEIRAALPARYYRSLPVLLDAPLVGLPRIYGVAWAFVAHTDSAFDEALLQRFLDAYQDQRELGQGELWALPTSLRVVLVENLRRLAEGFDRSDPALAPGQHSADQAADLMSMRNAVTALRLVAAADWSQIVARCSRVIRVMKRSALFEAEDDASRDLTLHGIERLAQRCGLNESVVAHQLLQAMDGASGAATLAGHWLRGDGRSQFERGLGLVPARWRLPRSAGALPRSLAYLATLLCGTALLLLALTDSPAWHSAGGFTLLAGLLLLLPASETVVALLNRLIAESVRPARLPRLLLPSGIPEHARVMVVIPALLSSAASIDEMQRRLQLHQLANPEAHAQFALLSDWVDADSAQHPDDHALLAHAREGLEALNRGCPVAAGEPPRFLLLHRARSLSATQGRWLGWERKRGKLEQLVAALALGQHGPFFDLGDLSQMAPDTRYILTLDSDTVLPPGRLRALVGVAEHPHNRPVLDETGRRVQRGYGILQPRVVPPLDTAARPTLWQGLFAGQTGLDPYSAVSSDVYQDVFGEGSFTGKGLLHVATLHAVLGERLPSEQVLSHDLLEGALVRCAVVSDITLIESEPEHADAHASRLHRWARGDWQLLPFLLQPRRWPLGLINRWKLFDNLRRSLVAPASLGLIGLAMAGVGPSLALALGIAFAAWAAGPLMGALAACLPPRGVRPGRRFVFAAAQDLARAVLGGLWHVALLLQQSLAALDAVGRTLYRCTVSRRQLLQWTTAEAAQLGLRPGLFATVWRHRAEPLAALVLAALLGLLRPEAPAGHWALLTLWALAPVLVWFCNTPWRWLRERPLSAPDSALLHDLARDTWRWFERCVNAQHRHLPPDNLQTEPYEVLAPRTSPTNIGLYLLSTACARQFGWIGSQDLLDRLEATLATLLQMERHRGHFLNWYHTETLAPLPPSYVSTVDSGNLCVHLLATSAACLELADNPFTPAASEQALALSLARLRPRLGELQALLRRPLHTSALGRLLIVPALDPAAAADALATAPSLDEAERELLELSTPHDPAIVKPATTATDELLWLLADHLATQRSAERDRAAVAVGGAAQASARLRALAQALEQLAWEPEFGFLYHPRRHLLHIGYRVAEQTLDASFYDLLASESRSTSLLAIAKGDLPARHWAALGRPFVTSGRGALLRSWSGSMFEYLMPSLVMKEPAASALGEAAVSALREQMAFVRGSDLPWGISECAYALRDHSLAYQYAPQGVPALALRRTPPEERVIAPYATALATLVDARLACRNLRHLQRLGARGRYGFVEALDFTPSRQTEGGPMTLVSTFMAHHQGMSLVALANVLLGGVAQRWGMAHARLQAIEPLLHERAPRALPHAPTATADALPAQPPGAADPIRHLVPGAQALEPTQWLSNGRYSLTLRANGAGWSRWGRSGISRWRDDALRDEHGSFVYLRLDPAAPPVSVTSHPAPDPDAVYLARLHSDRVCFEARWPGLEVQSTVWISPEDDIELRKLVLHNRSALPAELELISALDITLASHAADEAHPAFSNLFVSADWLPAQQALRFERRPRLQTEAPLLAAHFLAGHQGQGQVLGLRYQTDRQRWLGRNHSRAQPLAQLLPVPLEATVLDTGLDPVAVLGVRLRLPPGARCTLTFATAASDNADTLRAVIDKYRQPSYVERSSAMSAALAAIPAPAARPRRDERAALQSLCTALLLTLPRPHALDSGAPIDRRLLWPLGLSGERPLLLVTAASEQGLGLLRCLALALADWARAGIACDLVVLSRELHSYQMPLARELAQLREQHQADQAGRSDPNATGFFVRREDELSAAQLTSLHGLARMRLQADGRSLPQQVAAWSAGFETPMDPGEAEAVPLHSGPLMTRAARGAFTGERGDFSLTVSPQRRPLRPWINVLANPGFGAQVSESGAGNSWAGNSRLHQLSAWSNDPVADPPCEWFLLQDRRSRDIWSLTPSAWGDEKTAYQVVHGQGHTSISHRRGDISVSLRWCVDSKLAIKQLRISLHNHGSHKAHLRLTGMVEWLMGEKRADRATLQTRAWRDAGGELQGLLATQSEAGAGWGGATAFFCETRHSAGDAEGLDWTCDRRAFFNAQGQLVLPQQLGQRAGYGLDPCAALSRLLTLRPGSGLEQVFLIGHADSPEAARALMNNARETEPLQREQTTQNFWDELLGATQVQTPDPLFDVLVNRWLLYQTVSSRLWAKAGFYQAGGATGFRDQLQDAVALVWARPELLREQIKLCATRQFEAGDVQHWWHSPGGAGVRTHFSDDLLWLPFATSHYLKATGDLGLLEQRLPFLDGPPIPEGAEDIYNAPATSEQQASVFEHGARAIDHSLAVGAHGLPLMGGGDWNDGMNRVGDQGRGESVWLAWFLCCIVTDWLPLAHSRGEHQRVARWQEALSGWRVALGSEAWDGAWFKRAFFDDGTPLGTAGAAEARIDLIAQAWAVLSQQTSPERQRQAMAAVETELVNPHSGLIQLLAPPLAHGQPSAGYIQAYPPGVRENGGQYSHAGVWALMAAARLARDEPFDSPARDTPHRYFSYLSPAHRSAHALRGPGYGLEPYAMAADVYSQAPYEGRGGWSWYTGAAGWLHRAAIESIFGLDIGPEHLSLNPCLPLHWPRAELRLQREGRVMRLVLLRATPDEALERSGVEDAQLLLPGELVLWAELPALCGLVVPLLPAV